MPLDPSIILGFKPPVIESPLNALGEAMKVKNQQQQGELGALQLQEGQRTAEESRQTAEAYKTALNPDGSINRNNLYTDLAKRGLGGKLPGIQKGFADQDKSKADTEKAQIEAHLKKFEVAGQIMAGVNNQATWEQARAKTAEVFGPEVAAQMPAVYDPAEVERKRQQALTVKEQLEQQWKAMEYTTPKADAVLSSNTSIDNNKRTNATTQRGQNMVDARARETADGVEQQFTPEAIDNAASRYNIDGTLPPMGMGKAGAMGRSAILNRAAELAAASGRTGDEQRIDQIGNKANTAALSKLQQQQTMVGAFERNFVKNADIALELSAKVDRTGIPMANKWLNAGKRSIAGDADLAAFDQAIKSASNEYAKIISGSMGNTAVAEGQIKSMEEKLNSAQTPQQVEAVIALMKRETQNRMTAFDDEKASLRTTMSGKKPTAPAAPAGAPAPAGGAGWSITRVK